MTSVRTPFFWFEIIGGLLIPFLLLVCKRRSTVLVVLACIVMFGVFCKRVWLLLLCDDEYVWCAGHFFRLCSQFDRCLVTRGLVYAHYC